MHGAWRLDPGGTPNGTYNVPCPNLSVFTNPCGATYQPIGTGGYSFLNDLGCLSTNAAICNTSGSSNWGWHNYDPTHGYLGTGSNAQNYLNTLKLCNTSSTTCSSQTNDLTLGANITLNIGTPNPVSLFRAPNNDVGYYLSTPGSSSITLQFGPGTYINTVDFEWGSVDPWNKVTFNYASGASTVVYGNNLCGGRNTTVTPNGCVNITDPSHSSTNPFNSSSTEVEFTVPTGDSNWTSVTFTACSDPNNSTLLGACYPAFEFDDLMFITTTSSTSSAFGASPTPEPWSMLLLGTGIAGVIPRVRRKLRS